MSTLTVTQQQASGRRAVAAFADFMAAPPDVRESLREALRESVPAEVTDEQIGWTLAGLGTSLIALVNVALANAGQVEDVIPPRMLAVLCSAAEGFITQADLAGLDL